MPESAPAETPPPGADPPDATPPESELSEGQIEVTVERYLRELARYEKTAAAVAERLARELRAAQLRHLLAFRAKHPDDLREKLRRYRREAEYSFSRLSENLNNVVTDLAGCRVVVYDPAVRAQVDELVQARFRHPDRKGAREEKDLPSGYRSIHHLVLLPESPEALSVQGAICEIQICSVAAHLFNELEHDIRYKDRECPPTQDEDQLLSQLLHATKLDDEIVRHLLRRRSENVRARTTPLDGPAELRYMLEQSAGRPLRGGGGDFVRLFRLLDTMFDPLTPSALERAGALMSLMTQGATEVASLGLDAADDVVHLALGLMRAHHLESEFRHVAEHWRGPVTSLKTAILKAAAVDRPASGCGDG